MRTWPSLQSDADGGDGVDPDVFERSGRKFSFFMKLVKRDGERDAASGDRSGAGAAVGLKHVAVDDDLSFAQAFEIDHRAKRARDEALDFLRAAGDFFAVAFAARMGRAREHRVLGGDPAAAFAQEPGRNGFVDRSGAEHVGVAGADDDGAFGVAVDVGLDRDGADLQGLAAFGIALQHTRNIRRHCIFSVGLL